MMPGETAHGRDAGTLLQLFAVPLAIVDDLVDDGCRTKVADWVMSERALGEGVRRSVVGGWHSRADLPARGVSALDRLFESVVAQVRDVHSRLGSGPPVPVRYLLQAWATVLEQGHYAQVHDHADAHWSAVYYVDAGDCDDESSGRISWINPVGGHRALPGAQVVPTAFSWLPRTGQLLIFPGWLRHAVEPYRGTRPRIAVAANIEVRLAR
jgi:uncharacterized protein (TIGR02466 family)